MLACEAVEEKKRKRTMSRSSEGSSSGSSLKYRHGLRATRGTAAQTSTDQGSCQQF
jgi:hypothetical protein